jgi:ribosomal protein S18 acetylase RimI-like enzyme
MSSTTTYKVRPATLRDAKAIAEIHNANVSASYKSLLSTVIPLAMTLPARQAYWKEAIEYAEPQVQLVLDDEKIVGFAGFDRCRDPKTPATLGEIWAIHVQASHHNTGAGLALWDATREALVEEGCTHVCVWVPLSNDRAMHFFGMAGFKREMSSAKTVTEGGVKIEEIRLKRTLA